VNRILQAICLQDSVSCECYPDGVVLCIGIKGLTVCKNTGLRRIFEPNGEKEMGGYMGFLNKELKICTNTGLL
jgi:hypothetical protein